MWKTFSHWRKLFLARRASIYGELSPQTRMNLRRHRRKYARFLRKVAAPSR